MNNILLLKKELYDENSILRAIDDYSKIATILYMPQDEYWKCVFERVIYSLDRTKKEFENYLIVLENKKGGLNDSL